MEAASEFAQLQLRCMDQVQWRYELIRPLVLFEECPAPPEAIRQRADATGHHPETVRKVAGDRKSTRLNSSHIQKSRMPSSA